MGISDILRKRKLEQAAANKQAGVDFLNENAKRQEVIVTNSGLQYEVISEGTGNQPTATSSVTCHYEGKLIDGKVFDSSIKRGQPATFPLDRVIAGWTEGLQYMSEGAKYRFFIPQELGYGEAQVSTIPPCSTLIFDVELIKVN